MLPIFYIRTQELQGGRTQFLRALLLTQFSARTRIALKNMESIQRSFYLLDLRAICTIFLHNLAQCIDGFTFLLQRNIRIGNNARNPEILRFFFVINRTQCNISIRCMRKSQNLDFFIFFAITHSELFLLPFSFSFSRSFYSRYLINYRHYRLFHHHFCTKTDNVILQFAAMSGCR